MIPSLITAWTLASIPAHAADRCAVTLPRPPKVVVAKDFRPAPEQCADPALSRCRTKTTLRADAPATADYTIRCSEPKPAAPPAPKAARQSDEPLLEAIRSGPWIDGVAIVVPSDTRCVPLSTVSSRLARNFPGLSSKRAVPPEKEPRVRVWELTMDEEGFASVSGPGHAKPVRGLQAGKLPDAVCRSIFEFEGKRRLPKTRTIVATCRGSVRPKVSAACGGGDVVWSDLRRLVSGSGNDPGTAQLKILAATDDEVLELSRARPKAAAPKPAPPRRELRTCDEGPRPVPVDQMVAVWGGARDAVRSVVEAAGTTSCAVVPADLDPDGLVLKLGARTFDDPEDQKVLGELWQTDAGLGSAMLAALNPDGGGRSPAIRAGDLERLATTAMEDRRTLELTRRVVDEYQASRQALLSSLQTDTEALPAIESRNAATAGALAALRAQWATWPPHARERLDDLQRERASVGAALRDESLREVDHRAGNGVALELIKLVGRIETDPVHGLHVEAEAIAADLDAAVGVEKCRAWLTDAEAEVSAPMSLEEAIASPEAFRIRRDVVAEMARRLDDSPCRTAATEADGLAQRVRNLEVDAAGVSPRSGSHPSRAEADRMVRRSQAWIRGTEQSGPARVSVALTGARRLDTESPPTRLGLSLGLHGPLWYRGATVLGLRVLPAWRQRLGETRAVRSEVAIPVDLFLGLGPAWRERTVVQPQIHAGGEVRLPWFGQEIPVRGAARVGGGVWLQPVPDSGHGVHVDLTAAFRPIDDGLRNDLFFEVGYHFQWTRRAR